jgi:elongator complex protein 2
VTNGRSADANSTASSLLLASGSNDAYVRLWRIQVAAAETAATEAPAVRNAPTWAAGMSLEAPSWRVDGRTYTAALDALLLGHEGWVMSVAWHPRSSTDAAACLLTASMDKSLVVWQPHAAVHGVWVEAARMGEVGGTTLGFFGAIFDPSGTHIAGHTFQGAFHHWRAELAAELDGGWTPGPVVSGHVGPVHDVAWDVTGAVLLSASDDQSTRLWAPWRGSPSGASWVELARPQAHGYDMRCLASLRPYVFVSGADEKVLRVFEAPQPFFATAAAVTGRALPGASPAAGVVAPRALAASVPTLGLSNKAHHLPALAAAPAAAAAGEAALAQDHHPGVSEAGPPLEEDLLQNTLWPEVQKLYGHGHELLAVAATHDGSLVVSACKAASADQAGLIAWSPVSWLEAYRLPGHSLSVTQLAFSHRDEFLLSGSRDRSWCLYRREASDGTAAAAAAPVYTLVHWLV